MVIYSSENDGTLNAILSGKVTREPEIRQTTRSSIVKFSVSYGKSKFMDCEAWADSAAGQIAGHLEKGDTVLVTGVHRSHEYNGKIYQTVMADAILVSGIPFAPMLEEASEPPAAQEQKKKEKERYYDITAEDDDLPF